ncbi:restriction endonuclease subunit S [Acinetobacter sp.]|uniref:restriction endonuclease subunit S n=3 Tax=unclassified Acinetobacter TaxID=196816 RepID=UPI0028A7A5BC|nr:restriction endonuclease subunit S [Acinetobacter sp.]
MAKYQKYAEYQDSGVEWLEQVPKNWEIIKIKHLSSVKRGASPRPIDDPKYFDDNGEYAWVRIADVSASDTYLLNTTQTMSDLGSSLSVKLEPNELFLSIAGTVGKPCINKIKACIHDGFVYFPDLKIPNKFLFYVFAGEQAYKGLGKMGTQLNLNTDTVGDIKVALPKSIEDIQNIINFLDHETAQIDSLIAKQEKLIELLKEKRQAVISHAVTKGLNPDVNMKDSGVEWLGQVPEHWNVLPIKYLTKYVGTGGTPKNQSSFAEVPEINWFTPGDFSGDLKIVDSSKYVTFSSVEDGDSKLYEGKSVLMIGIGATLGKVAISDRDFSCNQQINVLTCNKLINPEFLTFSLMSQLEQIKQLSNSSTIGIINQEKTKQISITVPSVEEQNKIIHFIMDNIEKFNTLINKAESAIQLMQERRTALISSAVTGKIDVRNWQHPNEAKTEFSA